MLRIAVYGLAVLFGLAVLSLALWPAEVSGQGYGVWQPIAAALGVYDVGGAASPGTYADGVLTTATGDLWGAEDSATLAVSQVDASVATITAKLTALESTEDWAKAGLTFRAGLNPDKAHVSIVMTPGKGLCVFARADNGGATVNTARLDGLKAPLYLRLHRSSEQITGYYSLDGSQWERVGSIALALDTKIYAGLVASGHGETAKATFAEYSLVAQGGAGGLDERVATLETLAETLADETDLAALQASVNAKLDAMELAIQAVAADVQKLAARLGALEAAIANARNALADVAPPEE